MKTFLGTCIIDLSGPLIMSYFLWQSVNCSLCSLSADAIKLDSDFVIESSECTDHVAKYVYIMCYQHISLHV